MADYVGDVAQQAKIQTDRPSGGGKWVKYRSRVVFSFFSFL